MPCSIQLEAATDQLAESLALESGSSGGRLRNRLFSISRRLFRDSNSDSVWMAICDDPAEHVHLHLSEAILGLTVLLGTVEGPISEDLIDVARLLTSAQQRLHAASHREAAVK